MTYRVPFSSIRRYLASVRYVSSNVPRTLTELEAHTGRLTYRSYLRDLSAYLLINKLMIMHSVRSTLNSKPYVQLNKGFFHPLMNSSKYFNSRPYMKVHFRDVKLSDVENFPNKFSEGDTKYFGEEDETLLQLIFSNYTVESSFEEFQDLILQIVHYLVELKRYPTYRLYEILADNFDRLGLESLNNHILDSVTKFPGEYANFHFSKNYLFHVDETLLKLILKLIGKQGFLKDYRVLLQLISVNSNLYLDPKDAASLITPKSNQSVTRIRHAFKFNLAPLRALFFPNLIDKGIYTKNGIEKIDKKGLIFMSAETCYLYLETAHRLGRRVEFQLLLRKWVLYGVLTEDRELKVLINGDFPRDLKYYLNLGTVEDFSILFNNKLIKLILKHSFVNQDSLLFKWILKIIKTAFIVNHRLYLKYTYPLGVIDNEIVSLIWLNCKNFDYEIYDTWILLEGIFKLEEIFNDFDREKFIALSCR